MEPGADPVRPEAGAALMPSVRPISNDNASIKHHIEPLFPHPTSITQMAAREGGSNDKLLNKRNSNGVCKYQSCQILRGESQCRWMWGFPSHVGASHPNSDRIQGLNHDLHISPVQPS